MSTVTVRVTDRAQHETVTDLAYEVRSALPLMPAVHSETLRRGAGLQTFPHYENKTYGKRPAVKARLAQLGPGMTRTRLVTNNDAAINWLKALYDDHGIKTNAVVGAKWNTTASEWSAIEAIVRSKPEMFAGLEPWNEPNDSEPGNPRPTDWDAKVVAFLRNRVTPLGRELGIPVLSPSLHDQVNSLPADIVALGDRGIGDLIDLIGIHRYPAGTSPSHLMVQRTDMYRAAWGDKPFRCTEGGYFTAPNYTGGAKPVTEAQQAAYASRHGLEWAWRGMKVQGVPWEFIQFEALNDVNPAGDNREAWLGIVRTPSLDPATWVNKQAYAVLQDLWNGMADPGPAFTPRPLPCQVTGPADLRSILTGKRDGTYTLYLWRDVDVDANGNTPSRNVTVNDAGGQQIVPVAGGTVSVPLGAPTKGTP